MPGDHRQGPGGRPPSPKVPEEDFARGVRLACQCRILSDLEVRIPVESDLDVETLSRTQDHPRGGRKVSYQELESLVLGWCFGPALRKYLVEMEPPTIQDNRSDLSRLLLALRKAHALDNVVIDPPLLRRLPFIVREGEWRVTATLRPHPGGIPAGNAGTDRVLGVEDHCAGARGYDPGALFPRHRCGHHQRVGAAPGFEPTARPGRSFRLQRPGELRG